MNQHPAPFTGYAGDNAILGVAASGTPPLFYQWFKDGYPIDDATNITLNLFNLQVGDEGDYSVIVTNAQGYDVSTRPHITVLPVDSVFTGLISHWPLDVFGTTSPDVTAKRNDLYPIGMDPTFLTGGVLSAIHFHSPMLPERPIISFSSTPIGMASPFIITPPTRSLFGERQSSQADRRVYAESSTNNNNPLFTIGTPNTGASGGVDIYIRNDGGGALLEHAKSSLVAFDNSWHHVAWVDNNGFGSIYVDGIKDPAAFNYVKTGLTLNVTALGTVYRTNAQALFTGSIDDVAVWGRSLSASEIQFVMTNSLPAPVLVATAVGEGTVSLMYTTPVDGTPRVAAVANGWKPERCRKRHLQFSRTRHLPSTISRTGWKPAFYRLVY